MAAGNQAEVDKKIISTFLSFGLASFPFILAGIEIWSFSKGDTSVFYLVLKHVDIVNLLLTSLFLLLPIFLLLAVLLTLGKMGTINTFLNWKLFVICATLTLILNLIYVPSFLFYTELLISILFLSIRIIWLRIKTVSRWREAFQRAFSTNVYGSTRTIIIVSFMSCILASSILIQGTDLLPREIVVENSAKKPIVHKGYVLGEEGKFTIVLQENSISNKRYKVSFIGTDDILSRSYEQDPPSKSKLPVLNMSWLKSFVNPYV